MISVLYASFGALLIIWLSLNVIKVRRLKHVSVGDGDDIDLITAIAAQSNALEYLPIALLLLLLLEYNGGWLPIVHSLGLLLLIGRAIHARAILTNNLKARVVGMQITIWVIIGLVITNIAFAPYGKIISL
jgi:uncharacterized membrane protein YecN with MAPEG domain